MIGPPVILGVDPGKNGAVACLVQGRPAFAETIRGDSLRPILGVVQHMLKLREQHGLTVIVVELQYIGRDAKFNPRSFETLLKRRHYWEILAEIYGLPVEQVYPATWQTVLRDQPKKTEDGTKIGIKVRSKAHADRFFPGVAKDYEQSDALGIAHWRWGRA
jgi:hypothetical protein